MKCNEWWCWTRLHIFWVVVIVIQFLHIMNYFFNILTSFDIMHSSQMTYFNVLTTISWKYISSLEVFLPVLISTCFTHIMPVELHCYYEIYQEVHVYMSFVHQITRTSSPLFLLFSHFPPFFNFPCFDIFTYFLIIVLDIVSYFEAWIHSIQHVLSQHITISTLPVGHP